MLPLELGRKVVITSTKVVGDVVEITLEASAAGLEFVAELASEVITFTIQVSRAALEASLTAAGHTLDFIVASSEVALKGVAIVAGSTAQVIGHTLVLATSPAVAVGIVLNDVGCQIYGANHCE